MDIKYQRYMNRELFPGNDISINGTKWYCFGHCTLVGSTINISLPVVIDESEEPHIARQSQMRRAEDCPSPPEGGRTPVENDILSQYRRIEVEELVGKNIVISSQRLEQLIIITDDKCYVNLEPHNRFGEMELIDEKLNLGDLKHLELLDDGVWEKYQHEKQSKKEIDHERLNTKYLNDVVRALGRTKVLELLDKSVE